MSDEQRPPDEEEQVNEAPVVEADSEVEKPKRKKAVARKAPEDVDDEDDEYEPITVEELKNEMREVGERVKAAWMNPLRRIVRGVSQSIVYPALDMVDGLAEALEGGKKRKGD